MCVLICLFCQRLKPCGCAFWIAPPNISLALTAAVSALISHWSILVKFTGGAEVKCLPSLSLFFISSSQTILCFLFHRRKQRKTNFGSSHEGDFWLYYCTILLHKTQTFNNNVMSLRCPHRILHTAAQFKEQDLFCLYFFV